MKLCISISFMFVCSWSAFSQDIAINEILASNDTTLSDPDFGEYADWFELHNTSTDTIDIGGYYLTDDVEEPTQWQIPEGTVLAPGGFLVIWADDEDTAALALHSNFKLSADGETLALFDTSVALIDSLSFPEQFTDISYGRYPDAAGTFAFFTVPTPGAANDTSPTFGFLDPPQASLDSGFYSDMVEVTLHTEDGMTIRFTLDGSAPTEESPVYESALEFSETTVVRAAAFAPDYEPSQAASWTFFVNESSDLPIISLVTDPAGFFSDEDGIYVEGTNGIPGRCRNDPVNWNQDWEREVHFSFFESDGSGGHALVLDHGAGAQIFGGCSRIYPQKSLSLHARSEYGSSDFAYQFFQDVDIESFDDLVLRSSAQDWWRTMFRDGMIQTLTRHMDLDGQAYRPTVVFLNGEYWGIHNLREKLNEDYVAGHYGIEDDDVELIEGTWGGQSDHYDELDALLGGDLNSPEVFAQIEARMDVDQYLTYLVAEIYVANSDWPGNNLKLWRPMTNDGRWRWMFFDADFGYGGNSNGQFDSNTLELATDPVGSDWPNPPWSTYLFRRLLTNDDFRHTFIQRMAAHASTTFDTQRTYGVIDSLSANIANEIERHKERWPQSISFGPTWESQVDIMRDFASARPASIRGHVTEYFQEVEGSARLTLTTTTGGLVHAAGVPMAPVEEPMSVSSSDVFEPVFYRGVPLELVAIPDDGFVFTGWSGLVDLPDDTVSIVLTESSAITANFALATSVDDFVAPNKGLVLSVYPVPATGSATVDVKAAGYSEVSLRIFDILGREVYVDTNSLASSGENKIQIDVSRLPSGSYFVVAKTPDKHISKRLVVVH